jgi:NAD(P)-dependent dehydrogenase (short-subunit alcohol dehydrogenase family)
MGQHVCMATRELSGNRILVVGATGVLGSTLATSLHAKGARLVVSGRRVDALASLANSLSGTLAVNGDLRDAASLRQVVGATVAHLGGLDGVVNAAGVVAFGNLLDTPDEMIEELFLTNVLGPLWLLRAALPHMVSGSFMLNISGVVAEQPLPGMAAYSSSKAAMFAADQALTRELRRVGVSMIDVRPPHTETGLATRSIVGTAPKMPEGLSPQRVVERIVAAISSGETDVPSTAF